MIGTHIKFFKRPKPRMYADYGVSDSGEEYFRLAYDPKLHNEKIVANYHSEAIQSLSYLELQTIITSTLKAKNLKDRFRQPSEVPIKSILLCTLGLSLWFVSQWLWKSSESPAVLSLKGNFGTESLCNFRLERVTSNALLVVKARCQSAGLLNLKFHSNGETVSFTDIAVPMSGNFRSMFKNRQDFVAFRFDSETKKVVLDWNLRQYSNTGADYDKPIVLWHGSTELQIPQEQE